MLLSSLSNALFQAVNLILLQLELTGELILKFLLVTHQLLDLLLILGDPGLVILDFLRMG